MPRAELHTHSTASDGAFEPAQVVEFADDRGVELLALTDHDNCDGCERARRAAEERGIEFLPGIEVSAYLDRSIHVLGLGVDPEGAAIRDLSERLYEARRERMKEMLGALADEDVAIEFEEVERLAEGAPLSRAHLGEALVRSGAVETNDQAFEHYIGVGAPAYVPVGWPSIPRTVDILHRAGGAAVLAHPGRYEVDDAIAGWAEAGLDGIEVSHPDHTRADERRYREMADELGLVATLGSDFHGRSEAPWEPFGSIDVPRSMLRALREAIARHS